MRPLFWMGLLIGLVPQLARAGNDDTYFMGTTPSLMAGAAVARSGEASGTWYNPAGLAAVEQQQLDLVMTAGSLQLRRIEAGLQARYDQVERSVVLDGSQLNVVSPSSVYVRRLGGFTLGVGLFVTGDEAIRTSGETTWEGGGERQILDAEIDATRVRYHGGIATGVRLSPQVRLGVGLFAVYEAIESNFDFGIGWAQPGLTRTIQLDSHDDAGRYGTQASVGLQVDVASHVSLGLLLRSPTLLLGETGTARALSTLAATGAMVPEPLHELTFNPDARERASVGIVEPARAVLGVQADLHGLQVAVEGEYAHPLRSLAVRSGLDPAGATHLVDRAALINLRLGALLRLTDALHLGAGFFTDFSPGSARPGLSEFATDYYGATLGLRHDTALSLASSERKGGLVFRTSIAVRYAVGVGSTGQLIADLRDPVAPVIDRSRTVDVTFHEFHLHLGSGLRF